MKSLILSALVSASPMSQAGVTLVEKAPQATQQAAAPQTQPDMVVARNDWVLPAIGVGIISALVVQSINDPNPAPVYGAPVYNAGYYPPLPAPMPYYGGPIYNPAPLPQPRCTPMAPYFMNGVLIVNQVVCQ